MLKTGSNDVLLDVPDEGDDEGATDFLDAALEPHIVMEEVPLACQDSQIDSKVVIISINDRKERIFYFLCDVEDSREVHHTLVVATELADTSDHHRLVLLPKSLQDRD